jgi:hypothetical protein
MLSCYWENRKGIHWTSGYHETVTAEPSHLPAVPHRKAGVQCDGSVVAKQDGDQITLKCNVCRTTMGTIHAAIMAALEQAIADAFVFRKFSDMDVPEVLTSISEDCRRGECERSTGHFHLVEHGDETILCVHSCHQVETELGPIN